MRPTQPIIDNMGWTKATLLPAWTKYVQFFFIWQTRPPFTQNRVTVYGDKHTYNRTKSAHWQRIDSAWWQSGSWVTAGLMSRSTHEEFGDNCNTLAGNYGWMARLFLYKDYSPPLPLLLRVHVRDRCNAVVSVLAPLHWYHLPSGCSPAFVLYSSCPLFVTEMVHRFICI